MKILIVDDVADNAELLRRLFGRRGHECHLAPNGEIAVAMTLAIKPDLVFMDTSMPVMDGLKATRIIRATEEIKDTPVVALTAHAMTKDREECFDAGCNAFATKPVDFAEIMKLAASFDPDLAGPDRKVS